MIDEVIFTAIAIVAWYALYFAYFNATGNNGEQPREEKALQWRSYWDFVMLAVACPLAGVLLARVLVPTAFSQI